MLLYTRRYGFTAPGGAYIESPLLRRSRTRMASFRRQPKHARPPGRRRHRAGAGGGGLLFATDSVAPSSERFSHRVAGARASRSPMQSRRRADDDRRYTPTRLKVLPTRRTAVRHARHWLDLFRFEGVRIDRRRGRFVERRDERILRRIRTAGTLRATSGAVPTSRASSGLRNPVKFDCSVSRLIERQCSYGSLEPQGNEPGAGGEARL